MSVHPDSGSAAPRLGFQEELVRTDRLAVDNGPEGYQRPLSETKVRRMGTYDVSLGGTVAVNRRPTGELFCFDGAHRLAAARRTGYTHIPAQVYRLTREKEARYFIEMNWATLVVSPRDKFRALVVAGDAETTAVKETIEACGFWLDYENKGRTADGVAAVETAVALCRSRGPSPRFDAGPLRDTLDLIHVTWQGQPGNATGYLLRAVAGVIAQARLTPRGLDRERFADELFAFTPVQLARSGADIAKSHKVPLWRGMGQRMINELNTRLPATSKNRIPPLV